MLRRAWALARDTVEGYVADEAMTRGAAIACYTVFSLAPLLVVAIAIAGLVFGETAAHGAVAEQLRGLVGREGAEAVQTMIRGAGERETGAAAAVGVAVLLVTASGVFVELQAALNAVWKAAPRAVTLSYLLRARALGVGLVAATGFLLLVSLLVSAALAALGAWAGGLLPGAERLLAALHFLVSLAMISALFAAIYK